MAFSFSIALLVLVQAPDTAEAPARAELLAYARRACRPTALGVYLGGEKAGWLLITGRTETREGRELLVVEDEFVVRSTYEGEGTSTSEWGRSTYALDGRGELLEIEERDEEDGTLVERSATLENGRFEIVVRGQGYETRREVAPPRSSLAEELRFEAWLSAQPEAGALFEMPQVDLEAEAIERTVAIRYLEPRRELLQGSLLPAHRLACEVLGLELEVTVLSDMRWVAGGFEGRIEFRLEDPATVKELAGPGPELMDFSVPCDEMLGEPERVSFLELELSAPGAAPIPVDHRQVVLEEGEARRVKIWRDPPSAAGSLLPEADSARYTSSSPALLCDHPEVLARARAVAGSSGSRREAALALMTWVNETLEPSYSMNAPTALDVLANRAGDCSEHALLFTAVARALRIPSRIVGGVMYAGDELAVFAWHAWAEFHDGERWISVDPTWGQMPVDATHIKLDEDGLDDDESWASHLGRLELWVVDSVRDPAPR